MASKRNHAGLEQMRCHHRWKKRRIRHCNATRFDSEAVVSSAIAVDGKGERRAAVPTASPPLRPGAAASAIINATLTWPNA